MIKAGQFYGPLDFLLGKTKDDFARSCEEITRDSVSSSLTEVDEPEDLCEPEMSVDNTLAFGGKSKAIGVMSDSFIEVVDEPACIDLEYATEDQTVAKSGAVEALNLATDKVVKVEGARSVNTVGTSVMISTNKSTQNRVTIKSVQPRHSIIVTVSPGEANVKLTGDFLKRRRNRSVFDILNGGRIEKKSGSPVTVTIASAKLKVKSIEDLEKDVFSNNKFKTTNLNSLLTGSSSKKRVKKSIKDIRIQRIPPVRLRLPKDFLTQIQRRLIKQDETCFNPFFSAGMVSGRESSGSFMDFAMQSKIAQCKISELSLKSNYKYVDVRSMSLEEFHVTGGIEIYTTAKQRLKTDYDSWIKGNFTYNLTRSKAEDAKSFMCSSMLNSAEEVWNDIADNNKDLRPNSIRERISHSPNLMWCEDTKPRNSFDALTEGSNAEKVLSWLRKSFINLRKSNGMVERQGLLRSKLGGRKRKQDDFIVDDNDSDSFYYSLPIEISSGGYEIVGTPYVPLMIIHGPTGATKTAAVYACVEELSGFIYEINTNQSHSKKALQKTLKELSTSHLVHQQKNQAVNDFEFQNGIILFENLDVLFKKEDKGFWDLFYSTLYVTRKPIVITCTDLELLPKKVREIAEEQGSLLKFEKIGNKRLEAYLTLVACTYGYVMDEEIIQDIVLDNNCDLRKCLNQLQYVCKTSKLAETDSLTKVQYKKQIRAAESESISLESYCKYSDLLSVADIITVGTNSTIKTNNTVNRFEELMPEEGVVDVDVDDDMYYENYEDVNFQSEQHKMIRDPDRKFTRAFELNIGVEILSNFIPRRFNTIDFEAYWQSPHYDVSEDISEYYQMYRAATTCKLFKKPDDLISRFKNFLNLRMKKQLGTARITRQTVNTSRESFTENFNGCFHSVELLPIDRVVTEVGPYLRAFSVINVIIHTQNKELQATSGLDLYSLIESGLLRALWYVLDEQVLNALLATACINKT